MPDYDRLILALDIGTSSLRAALYDQAGNMLPITLVRNERTLTATYDGGAEIDAEVAFKQIVRAIDDVLEKSGKVSGEITHTASCSFWHSLVGVNAKGKPTTPVFGWADTRSRKYTELLRRQFDEGETHNRTGARFHSSFWPAKLLWLRKDNLSIWQQTTKWLSFSDYVAMRLNGEPVTSVSMASATGLFDIRNYIWDKELIRFLQVKPKKLPEIAKADSDSYQLNSKFAKRWPRLKNAKWFPAIGDGAANNIGSGCTTRSQAALMIGTSGAMRVLYEGEPPKKIPPGLFCYRLDRKRVVLGGALSDGGNLYDWLKRNLRFDLSDAEIGKEMSLRGADAHGLTVMPFFNGERSTGYNENAGGSINGLTALHDAIDILQAAMEAVAYRFAEILDQLRRVAKTDEIVVSGGALENSPVWTQIIADILGHDLSVSNSTEASLRGAVLLALEAIGNISSIEQISTPKGNNFRFCRSNYIKYRAARKKHLKIYDEIV
ncbi:MAG: gluconokinase [Blastocatellia bacterium]